MKLVIIDGQGGKIGKLLIEKLKTLNFPEKIYAVGTNSIATTAMLKAGADFAATGENPVIVNARDADLIVGPIGIAIADALLGEITPTMATAISQSQAQKLLLPVNKCNIHIVGVPDNNISKIVAEAAAYIMELI